MGKKVIPYGVIFVTSGLIYIMLELLWRGRTHWTMFLCAGLCGLVMANINNNWLEFDTDMMRVSTPLYLGKDGNFVTYYVTVSGHSPYVIGGNISDEYDTDFRIQVFVSALMCSSFEFFFGIIFNGDFSIWDYRGMWGTIHALGDQVNVIFFGIWIIISVFSLPLLDYLQWKLGVAEEPYYRIGWREFRPWGRKE